MKLYALTLAALLATVSFAQAEDENKQAPDSTQAENAAAVLPGDNNPDAPRPQDEPKAE